jgi:hypothetical protein
LLLSKRKRKTYGNRRMDDFSELRGTRSREEGSFDCEAARPRTRAKEKRAASPLRMTVCERRATAD